MLAGLSERTLLGSQVSGDTNLAPVLHAQKLTYHPYLGIALKGK